MCGVHPTFLRLKKPPGAALFMYWHLKPLTVVCSSGECTVLSEFVTKAFYTINDHISSHLRMSMHVFQCASPTSPGSL